MLRTLRDALLGAEKEIDYFVQLPDFVNENGFLKPRFVALLAEMKSIRESLKTGASHDA